MDKEFTIARTTFSQSHREFHLTFSFNIFIALWGTLRSSSFLQRIPSSQFFHRFPFILIVITCKIKKKRKLQKVREFHPSNSSRFLNQIINRINIRSIFHTTDMRISLLLLREKHIVSFLFSDATFYKFMIQIRSSR